MPVPQNQKTPPTSLLSTKQKWNLHAHTHIYPHCGNCCASSFKLVIFPDKIAVLKMTKDWYVRFVSHTHTHRSCTRLVSAAMRYRRRRGCYCRFYRRDKSKGNVISHFLFFRAGTMRCWANKNKTEKKVEICLSGNNVVNLEKKRINCLPLGEINMLYYWHWSTLTWSMLRCVFYTNSSYQKLYWQMTTKPATRWWSQQRPS